MEYASSLQSQDKERYAEKLAVLYGSNTDSIDPFDIPDDKWVDDIFLWPPVEYGDDYTYLVDTPGQFTRLINSNSSAVWRVIMNSSRRH